MDKFYLCPSVYMNSPAHGTHLAQSRSKHVAIVEVTKLKSFPTSFLFKFNKIPNN